MRHLKWRITVATWRNNAEMRQKAPEIPLAWLRGDLAELASLPERFARQFPGMAPHYAALRRHIIEGRTVVMHHRLILPMRSGGVLVATGPQHLYGDAGLLALLARDGYRVTRVW